jgi:CheY-like chemotaxis protein
MNTESNNTVERTQETRRVLVVEDNPALAGVIQFNLERAGCTVSVTRNGQEALELLENEQFDVVITDQEMPQMTGIELCARIRALEHGAKLPVIMVTAKQMELNRDEVQRRFQIDAIMPKPFSPAELINLVEECLRGTIATPS